VARRFVDAYYVRMDLRAAHNFCTGLAAHKVAEELRLTQGQAIDASTRQPRIRYKLREQRESGEGQVNFLFEGSIEVEDAGTDKRTWLVAMRRAGDSWKVSNFVEFEEGGRR